MTTPRFLMADNSQDPERIYVVHTQDPHFVYDIMAEDFVWIENNLSEVIGSEDESEITTALTQLIEDALAFCRDEMNNMLEYGEE
ncbi:MAG: hypothetical protein N4A45_02290 [Flavobacteriales bacterium]|jgi:hypothetical protein|nr:hypothetical protein [Flavobacteriales bacterium]